MAILIARWHQIDPTGRGLTAAKVIEAVDKAGGQLEDWLRPLPFSPPSPEGQESALGYVFREFKRRVFGERCLAQAGTHGGTVRWKAVGPKDGDGDGGDRWMVGMFPPYADESESRDI